MDHHEQHRKEREERKKHEKEHERESEDGIRTIHPAWFVALGTVFIFAIIATWIVIASR
jgi:hypothetical protein